MSYTFSLTTKPTTPFLQKLHELLANTKPIANETAYNHLLQHIITLAKTYPENKTQGPLFQKEIKEAIRPYPLSEPTVWGGVVLKHIDVEKNSIRKLLIIKQYGILGFERHKKKIEKLNVLEGACILITAHSLTLATIGDKITLHPGDEHGIIALTNCVIEEKSTNHLDDLTYIFPSQQIV